MTFIFVPREELISELIRSNLIHSDLKPRRLVLSFIPVRDETTQTLRQNGFEFVFPHQCYKSIDSEAFLREYRDMISVLSAANPNRLYWATDIASKNRYASPIAPLLQQFLAVLFLKKEYKDYTAIVVGCSESVLVSLKKILRKTGDQMILTHEQFSVSKVIRNVLSYLKYRIFPFVEATQWYIRAMYARIIFGKVCSSLRHTAHPFYVIKTFFYDRSFDKEGNYTDSFFGRLPQEAHLRGEHVLVLGRVLGEYQKCVRSIQQTKTQFTILPFDALLHFSDIVQCLQEVFSLSLKLPQLIFFGHDVTDIMKEESRRACNGIALSSLLHFYAIKRLTRMLYVKTFIYTYENNPWERMSIAALRQTDKGTYIIGYQHTVVHQAAVNVFIGCKDDKKLLPDRVVTVGDRAKTILERYGCYIQGHVVAGCALRFEYLSSLHPLPVKKGKKILLILDDALITYKLLEYALRQGEGMSMSLRIRAHPALSLSVLERMISKKLGALEWIEESHGSVREDIEWSDVVLYSGSAIALEALIMGRPLICYQWDSILSFDPLFECGALKWNVGDTDSLHDTLQAICSLQVDEYRELRKVAQTYLREYFYPITTESLQPFFISQNPTSGRIKDH